MKSGKYGPRTTEQEHILVMDKDELFREFPWLEEIEFEDSEVQVKDVYPKSGEQKLENYQVGKISLPKHCAIKGVRTEDTKKFKRGDDHYYVIGTPSGKIMPKLLQTKWTTIESGKAYGKDLGIDVSDGEKAKMYALVRLRELEMCDVQGKSKKQRTSS